MFEFIPQITLFLSAAFILSLLIKAAPRIDQEELATPVQQPHDDGRMTRLINRLPLEKMDEQVHKFLEKFLRKFRVVLMKIDNKAIGFLDKVRSFDKKDASADASSNEFFGIEAPVEEDAEIAK